MVVGERLASSGEREKLRVFLRAKLRECGWREDMKSWLRDHANHHYPSHALPPESSSGSSAITTAIPPIEWLVAVALPHAFTAVPPSVKSETLLRIRRLLVLSADQPQQLK